MGVLEIVLAFLGGGSLATILAFVLDIRKQNKTNKDDLIKDIYEELGRIKEELKQVKEEKQGLQTENLELKERNMRLQLEIEDLKKDYQELKAINEELRRKLDMLLNRDV